jgi:hypothetical protein
MTVRIGTLGDEVNNRARRGKRNSVTALLSRARPGASMRDMAVLPLLAPLFLLLEVWQLFMSERYVGIKQIARGGNPREMGPSEPVALLWSAGLLAYAAWALALLAVHGARVFALLIIATTAIGYPIRRNCSLKWILVALTCEGAVRIGFLSALSYTAWARL